jgi:hypothetical protein
MNISFWEKSLVIVVAVGRQYLQKRVLEGIVIRVELVKKKKSHVARIKR